MSDQQALLAPTPAAVTPTETTAIVPHDHMHVAAHDPRRHTTLRTVVWAGATLAFGLWFGSVVFDWHAHACARCGRRWRHLGAFNFNSEAAHACPGCGAVEWRKAP